MNYYVTVIRDNGDYRPLLGPFEHHTDAMDAVSKARAKACELDPKAHWYAFGTSRIEGYDKPGILNSYFEVTP